MPGAAISGCHLSRGPQQLGANAVQSIEEGEVVYRAACGAAPAMIARTSDQTCSLTDFAAEVEAEVSPDV
jgi:hypothetical protein